MSSHSVTVSLGRTGSANGSLKTAEVVGHLYVGGSGSWRFHRLSADEVGGGPMLVLPSRGFQVLWQEVAAGFAVLMRDHPGLERVAEGLAALGVPADLKQLEPAQVSAVAALVGEVDVAAALTAFGGDAPQVLGDLSDVPGGRCRSLLLSSSGSTPDGGRPTRSVAPRGRDRPLGRQVPTRSPPTGKGGRSALSRRDEPDLLKKATSYELLDTSC